MVEGGEAILFVDLAKKDLKRNLSPDSSNHLFRLPLPALLTIYLSFFLSFPNLAWCKLEVVEPGKRGKQEEGNHEQTRRTGRAMCCSGRPGK